MGSSAPYPLDFVIRPVEDGDRAWVTEMVLGWGADFIISRGRVVHPQELPGFCAVTREGGPLGLATYDIVGTACELVTLDAAEQRRGVGTALLTAVRDAAAAGRCSRLWLVTTNDNLDALRFYQRRGMHIAAVHHGLREAAARLKPTIPLTGCFGIPILDEIELEMLLDRSCVESPPAAAPPFAEAL